MTRAAATGLCVVGGTRIVVDFENRHEDGVGALDEPVHRELKDAKMWTAATHGSSGTDGADDRPGQPAIPGRRRHRGPEPPHGHAGRAVTTCQVPLSHATGLPSSRGP